VLGWALLMPAGDFKYDVTLLRVMVLMSAAARSVWLIEKRSDSTRQFVVGAMIVVLILSVLDMIFGGEYGRIAAVVSMPVLVAGDWTMLLPDDEQVFAFERTYKKDRVVTLANFSDGSAGYDAALVEGLEPLAESQGATVIGELRPLEAVVFGTR
jgi:hypothetical protein